VLSGGAVVGFIIWIKNPEPWDPTSIAFFASALRLSPPRCRLCTDGVLKALSLFLLFYIVLRELAWLPRTGGPFFRGLLCGAKCGLAPQQSVISAWSRYLG
jgi:hypothetical protein